MAYTDPPAIGANVRLGSSGGGTSPYDVNAKIIDQIKSLYDLLTGDEAFVVDAILKVGAGLNAKAQLGDNAGANKFCILDSDGTEVASINSDGGLILASQSPLAGTKNYYVADSSGGAVTRKLTFINGILTAET
jgi:hypothetical protein